MREEWPDHLPVFVRHPRRSTAWISAGRSRISVAFATALRAVGVDVVDCSSGGMETAARQLGIADPGLPGSLRRAHSTEGGPTVAVGLIREPEYAEAILRDGEGHAWLRLGREPLCELNWPAQMALALGCDPEWSHWPWSNMAGGRRRVAQQGK